MQSLLLFFFQAIFLCAGVLFGLRAVGLDERGPTAWLSTILSFAYFSCAFVIWCWKSDLLDNSK